MGYGSLVSIRALCVVASRLKSIIPRRRKVTTLSLS